MAGNPILFSVIVKIIPLLDGWIRESPRPSVVLLSVWRKPRMKSQFPQKKRPYKKMDCVPAG